MHGLRRAEGGTEGGVGTQADAGGVRLRAARAHPPHGFRDGGRLGRGGAHLPRIALGLVRAVG